MAGDMLVIELMSSTLRPASHPASRSPGKLITHRLGVRPMSEARPMSAGSRRRDSHVL